MNINFKELQEANILITNINKMELEDIANNMVIILI